MKRLLATLGVVLVAAVAGAVASAPAASAHEVCSGTRIDTYNVRTSGAGTGGTHYATIRLYYSSANGGTNCASLEKVRWHDGTTRNDMYLEIGLCDYSGCPRPSVLVSNHSPNGYLYYAGPVSMRSAAKRCVYLSAHMYSSRDHSGTRASRTVRGVHGPGCPDD
ncbi:hypothetical protein [Plantactinospora soyae]|uniref:Spore-associated protein A n=1 Tax=Plantactinospora soyae TaxID=1544732 RepID=A0A927M163_9ACTN|nr:hypothetical protein [Plantactinospora soyae]MBE1484826.1 hypothetical protein [Plantactinospora soyae]